ncbi:MAG: Fe-S cluster protein, partial [Gammaproteobacteria bacterium]
CGKCAVDAPPGVITMVDNLPIVDYDRRHDAPAAIERCPTGAIVWFDKETGPRKGRAAHRVIREGERSSAAT